jgi:hypothetical protein
MAPPRPVRSALGAASGAGSYAPPWLYRACIRRPAIVLGPERPSPFHREANAPSATSTSKGGGLEHLWRMPRLEDINSTLHPRPASRGLGCRALRLRLLAPGEIRAADSYPDEFGTGFLPPETDDLSCAPAPIVSPLRQRRSGKLRAFRRSFALSWAAPCGPRLAGFVAGVQPALARS